MILNAAPSEGKGTPPPRMVGWTPGLVAVILFFSMGPVYDFAKERRVSLSGAEHILVVAGAILLAPVKDESPEGRAKPSHSFRSPRFAAGVAVCIAAACIFVFRVGRDFHLW